MAQKLKITREEFWKMMKASTPYWPIGGGLENLFVYYLRLPGLELVAPADVIKSFAKPFMDSPEGLAQKFMLALYSSEEFKRGRKDMKREGLEAKRLSLGVQVKTKASRGV